MYAPESYSSVVLNGCDDAHRAVFIVAVSLEAINYSFHTRRLFKGAVHASLPSFGLFRSSSLFAIPFGWRNVP